jgi:hypothetical protein
MSQPIVLKRYDRCAFCGQSTATNAALLAALKDIEEAITLSMNSKSAWEKSPVPALVTAYLGDIRIAIARAEAQT